MKPLTWVFALGIGAGMPAAYADVWLCKRGNVEEYTNVGDVKHCRKVELPGITTVPAARTNSSAARPAAGAASSVRPADFPRVDGGTQRARDDDRRKLLEDELKEQESKLAELRKDPNANQPEMRAQMSRAEANIASIKRELARVVN